MIKNQTKGQLISKCIFGVFTFFQKTNENKSTSSKVEFVCSFFGSNVSLKKSFRICLTFKETNLTKRPFLGQRNDKKVVAVVRKILR